MMSTLLRNLDQHTAYLVTEPGLMVTMEVKA